MSTDNISDAILQLIGLVHQLRRECPWDREQSHKSLRQNLLEECYEALDALDRGDPGSLKEEMGDILLQVLMHATIAEEEGTFTLNELVEGLDAKLRDRHPHIFGSAKLRSAKDVNKQWGQLKLQKGRSSALDGIPAELPALQRALVLQERAAQVGFDKQDTLDVLKAAAQEMKELEIAMSGADERAREDEFGDFLFALVNYARFNRINPENALRATIEKFVRRFQFIEENLKKQGKDIHASTLKEMDALWNNAKKMGR
jgi:MazG family protein